MAKKVKQVQFSPSLLSPVSKQKSIRRIAIYARVSTASDEQLHSIVAQKEYYQRLIDKTEGWSFAGLYADEGISGLARDHRLEFNRMMSDAQAGRFDMIVTKSISRFARNTVDTLTCIRKLKELRIEVYFEKEDIRTFDSKGEFMLTLLSSMAQEESRSISENVTWSVRKRFSEGSFSLAYSNFLGYAKGKDKNLVIIPHEAEIVRFIYYRYLYGYTSSSIVSSLESMGIPSPAHKTKWYASVILSILGNEKYKGDALLQKRFTVDFIGKKMKNNEGELPMYYVSNSHEAIIPSYVFDYVQVQRKYRTEFSPRKGLTILHGKVLCQSCGGKYVIRYYHKRKDSYWMCTNRYPSEKGCQNSVRFRGEVGQMACVTAVYVLLLQQPKAKQYIENCCKEHSRLHAYVGSAIMYKIPFPEKLIVTNDIMYAITDYITVCTNRDIIVRFMNGCTVTLDMMLNVVDCS